MADYPTRPPFDLDGVTLADGDVLVLRPTRPLDCDEVESLRTASKRGTSKQW